MGCFEHGVSGNAEGIIPLLVRHDEQEVQLLFLLWFAGAQSGQEQGQDGNFVHIDWFRGDLIPALHQVKPGTFCIFYCNIASRGLITH